MATVKRFEDLEVYKLGLEITEEVWTLCRQLPKNEFAALNQLKRSALSIVSNIAEGYERGSRTEFIQFCYIAKGSAGELRAQLDALSRVGLVKKDHHDKIRKLCLRESGAWASFCAHLKRSKGTITGDKFLPAQ